MNKIILMLLLSFCMMTTQGRTPTSVYQVKEKTYTIVYQEMKDYGGTFVWEETTVQCKSYYYTQVNCVLVLMDDTKLYCPKNQIVSITENK